MRGQQTESLATLERRREVLRSSLARAWELREPMEHIHRIEEQMRALWAQLDAAESFGRRGREASA